MANRVLILILSAWLLTGCACSKAGKTTGGPEVTTSTSKSPQVGENQPTEEDRGQKAAEASSGDATETPGTGTNPCRGERNRFLGNVTLNGQVGRTKGGILTLGGVMLTFPDRKQGRVWYGKNVTATGDLCEYTCQPMEQCLIGGKIRSLRNLEISEDSTSP